MDAVNSTAEVKLQIPQSLYQILVKTAAAEHQQLEAVASQMLQAGLKTHDDWQQLWGAIALSYRDRLQQEGKLHQSSAEVLQELRAVRDAIADELYPE
jgi:hypothetical protein